MATLPGAWHYRVSAGTGWPSVSILWLGEVQCLICNFYLSVAARNIVCADPSLRYTSMLPDVKQPTNKPTHSILTLSQPYPGLTVYWSLHDRVAPGLPSFKSLAWLDPENSHSERGNQTQVSHSSGGRLNHHANQAVGSTQPTLEWNRTEWNINGKTLFKQWGTPRRCGQGSKALAFLVSFKQPRLGLKVGWKAIPAAGAVIVTWSLLLGVLREGEGEGKNNATHLDESVYRPIPRIYILAHRHMDKIYEQTHANSAPLMKTPSKGWQKIVTHAKISPVWWYSKLYLDNTEKRSHCMLQYTNEILAQHRTQPITD